MSDSAASYASSGVATTRIPPPFPRPPACTSALITVEPSKVAEAFLASSAVEATSPVGIGMP